MGFLSNYLKAMRENNLVQMLTIVLVLLFSFVLIYALSLRRAGIAEQNMLVQDPQFRIDTLATDSTPQLVLVDNIHHSSLHILPEVSSARGFDRLVQQLASIRMRSISHNNYTRLFLRVRYAMNIIQAFAALLAVITGLYITRSGFARTHSIVLVSFFVCTAFTTVLQILPESLNIKENINLNREQYLSYKELEREIFTYFNTGLDYTEEPISVAELVVRLDGDISHVHDISMDFQNFPAHKIQEHLQEIDHTLKRER